jgi:hypothetical protein
MSGNAYPPSHIRNIDHVPEQPSWDCKSCGKPWPCDPAREALVAEYAEDSTSLSVLMWGHMSTWIMEALGNGPMREGWDRFIAWTRPADH